MPIRAKNPANLLQICRRIGSPRQIVGNQDIMARMWFPASVLQARATATVSPTAANQQAAPQSVSEFLSTKATPAAARTPSRPNTVYFAPAIAGSIRNPWMPDQVRHDKVNSIASRPNTVCFGPVIAGSTRNPWMPDKSGMTK